MGRQWNIQLHGCCRDPGIGKRDRTASFLARAFDPSPQKLPSRRLAAKA
jgi:hypothetical protein